MITIVLVNWNAPSHTLICLASLMRLKGPQPSIIVCDNDSRDDSYEIIREALLAMRSPPRTDWQPFHFWESVATGEPGRPDAVQWPEIALIRTSRNRGFAGGVNVGLRAALAEPGMRYVWILNNDTQVHRTALDALLVKMASDPKIGICGSTLLYLDEPQKIQAVGGCYNSWLGTTRHCLGHETYSAERCRAFDETTLDYVVGAAMFVPRAFLETVGLMDERYFLYYEEIDWACQMRRRRPDLHLAYAPDSIVYHAEGSSTGSNDRNGKRYVYRSDYYMLTSRLKCTHKNFSMKLWSVRLSMLLVMLNRMRRRQWVSAQLALRLCLGLSVQSLAPSGR